MDSSVACWTCCGSENSVQRNANETTGTTRGANLPDEGEQVLYLPVAVTPAGERSLSCCPGAAADRSNPNTTLLSAAEDLRP